MDNYENPMICGDYDEYMGEYEQPAGHCVACGLPIYACDGHFDDGGDLYCDDEACLRAYMADLYVPPS